MVSSKTQRLAAVRYGIGLVLALCVLPGVALAGARDAAEKVRQGIEQFDQGQYEVAGKSFFEADSSLPENRRIAFDRACAYAAGGDADQAIDLLIEAAGSTDPELAIRCHYNLGHLKAAKARTTFGERPEEAAGAQREEGLQHLLGAVGHYRDCLNLDDDHEDARHNIELIRLWIKHMQAIWRQRDRQKQRDEMSLLEFLAMLEARQRALRLSGKMLAREPDSPRRRQQVLTTRADQATLAEEIEPLKEKITEALRPKQPPGTTPAPPQSADVDRVIALLTDLAGQQMEDAAERLAQGKTAEAVSAQTTAVEQLGRIYTFVVPLPNLVQRAYETEKGLVDVSKAAVEQAKVPEDQRQANHQTEDAAWNQRFVGGWADVLPAKAQQWVQQLEAAGPSAGPQPPGTAPKNAAEQQEAIEKTVETINENAPRISELSGEAADLLDDGNATDALPKQEEALRLLKEILDALPKDQQPQSNPQCDQDRDQSQNENQNQSQGQDQDERRTQQQRQDPSRQQTEALLKKARQRQKEDRELEKKLRGLIGRPGVEKDW